MLPATLIICSRNRPRLLQETVQSVLAGEEVPAEIVIVDQSDRPFLVSSEQCPPPTAVRYLHSSTRGVSRARNEGLAAARNEIVVYLDDDMFVEHDWFGTLVRALQASGPNTIVTGRVLPAQAEGEVARRPSSFVPAQVLGTEPAEYRGRLNRDVLAGGHMAAYRGVLEAVGRFDERLGAGSEFSAAEDNDMGFRLLDAGYAIRYVPEAVVYHRAWRPSRDYWRVRWAYGRGKGGFYMKHLRQGDTFMLRRMDQDAGQRIRAFPGRLLADPRRAAGDIVYLLGMLSGAVQWRVRKDDDGRPTTDDRRPTIAHPQQAQSPSSLAFRPSSVVGRRSSVVLMEPPASEIPPATLIICSRNRPRLLQETVQSVLAGEEVPAEIVIVDQSEQPHARFASPNSSHCPPPTAVRYLHSSTRGLSRARSIAVEAAANDILVFLDDDMLVAPDWFGVLVRELLRAGPSAVATGQVLPTAAESPGGFQLSIKVDPRPATYRGRIDRDELAGGHMAVYRSVLAAVGGFDERLGPGSAFPAAEDNDLGFRLLEAGYSIHYVPYAIVYHRAWRTWRHYLPLRWSYGLGQGAFYAKHLHGHDTYMLRRLGHDFRYFVRRPSRFIREPRWAVGYALFLLGILAGGARWLLSEK